MLRLHLDPKLGALNRKQELRILNPKYTRPGPPKGSKKRKPAKNDTVSTLGKHGLLE